MDRHGKWMTLVKATAGMLGVIGLALIVAGLVATGYNLLLAIGIGTVTGAGFIFLIGIFLAMGEEMVARTKKPV